MVSAALIILLSVASPALAAPRDYTLHKRCGEMVSPPGMAPFPNCWAPCNTDPACTGGAPPAPLNPAPAAQPAAPAPQAQINNYLAQLGGNSGNGYIDVINTYRQMMGKSTLSQSDFLQNNIQSTLHEHPGQMVHDLKPGSSGQVLAQGNCGDFTNALVHGWICEIPSLLPSGICNGGNYNSRGQTGHAQILSGGFTKVGCACSDGIWGCDFST